MVSPSPAAKATASRNPNPEIAPRPTAWLKSKTRPAAIVVSIALPFYCAFGCFTPSPWERAGVRVLQRLMTPPPSLPFAEGKDLQKPRFLERALDDRLGIDVQPVLQNGRVQPPEVQ